MSKYDSLKYWSRTRARITHYCLRCRAQIEPGDFYYKERIDFVHPPNIRLGELCESCGKRVSNE